MSVFRIWLAVGICTWGTCGAEEVAERRANNDMVVLQNVPPVPARIVQDLNRFQNIRGAAFDGWVRNGKGVYISTRFGDVSQLHRVEMPGGARHQLTFFPEPIGATSLPRDGEQMAFLMDAGGNENAQVFVLDPRTAEHRMVSDGSSRNGAVIWHPDGRHIACQSTRRNGRSNDVWLIDTADPTAAKLLLESPDGSWWGPAAFNDDGNQLLVQQYVSVSDSRIHLVDLDTGTHERVLGSAEAPTRNLLNTSAFGANDQGFYYVTDQEGDFAQLAYFDLASAKTTIVSGDIPWDVEDVALSNDGQRGAFVVNTGGVSQLYLFDTRTHRYEAVDNLPVGVIGGLAFSPQAPARLALTISTSKTPSDIFVLELAAEATAHKELVRWTYSEVGGLDTDQFSEPQLVDFPTFDQDAGVSRRIPAFVYKPRGKGPFPVIVSIHGGPESQFRPRFSSRFQLWMQKLGAAVIAPNVRGSRGYGKDYVSLDNGVLRENSVKDIGALLDWIQTQPDLDESRVAVYGGSYGGYMVLATSVHYSHRLKAAVDVVGISNFVTFLQNTQDYRRDLRRVEYGDERDPRMRAHLNRISPTNNVERIRVPMLVIQGQNDPRVPVTEAEQIVAALREQGNEVWYMNALNEGHGYRKKENVDLYNQVVTMFLEKYLLSH